MELYEALQNGVDKQKLIDDFVAQLHEAETRIERENWAKAKAEAEEKARKEKELAAQKMKDIAALKEAYKELEAATDKYWSLYAKVHPENSWLTELIDAIINNKDAKKVNTYQVRTPAKSDDEIIRKFINSLK